MTSSHSLFEAMKEAAIELLVYEDSPALHIFVADGNCDDEDLEFCLAQPNITDAERDFAERMLHEFTEEQRHGVWAFGLCSDIIAAAEAAKAHG